MNINKYIKLDNPAWYSLNETHRSFAVGNDALKFYLPEFCPFGGVNKQPSASQLFDEYTSARESFFIIGSKPQTPPTVYLEKELICLQMICPRIIEIGFTEKIVLLTNEHNKELMNLINSIQPGYFKEKTRIMGDYFGIFKNDKLIAVTGERMKMYDFTEISAVITHPDYLGKGFAKQLVAHAVNKNLKQNIIPYLHVVEDNIGAIKLYEKLGFSTRRKISFWKMGNHTLK